MNAPEIDFDWDEANIGHVARHGVLPDETEQVILNDPLDLGMEIVDRLCLIYGDVAPFGAGPNPTKIEVVGNSYLDREFPRLDSIKSARVSLK